MDQDAHSRRLGVQTGANRHEGGISSPAYRLQAAGRDGDDFAIDPPSISFTQAEPAVVIEFDLKLVHA